MKNSLTVSFLPGYGKRTTQQPTSHHQALRFTTASWADGLDVSGRNVHIHDCNIFVQDDCIAIKPHSENGSSVGAASSNILIERVNASGLGLVIGSIGASSVRNVTFRDSRLRKTVAKGERGRLTPRASRPLIPRPRAHRYTVQGNLPQVPPILRGRRFKLKRHDRGHFVLQHYHGLAPGDHFRSLVLPALKDRLATNASFVRPTPPSSQTPYYSLCRAGPFGLDLPSKPIRTAAASTCAAAG